MIVRLHARAGRILLGLLAFACLTAGAQATAYVTRHEMESYVWTVLAGVGVGTVLCGAGLLSWILSRDRALQQASIDLVIAATERLTDQGDRIEAQVHTTAAALHDLRRDHDRITGCPGTTAPAWDGVERRTRGRQ